MKIPIIIAMVLLLAGCSDIYEPCEKAADCDPEHSDGCAHIPGGPPGFCSIICEEARDCPPGPLGEQPSCIPAGEFKACSI